MEWIRNIGTHDPIDLEDPGYGWVSLDRKVAASVTKTAGGELGRQVTQASSIALNAGKIARGRMLIARVLKYYAAGSSAQLMFDINHLQEIVLKGENFESFQTAG